MPISSVPDFANRGRVTGRVGSSQVAQPPPQLSNDNPFSESQFKTLKNRPEFPQRLASYDHGLTFSREFFPWYI
jgi:hypothetical protein